MIMQEASRRHFFAALGDTFFHAVNEKLLKGSRSEKLLALRRLENYPNDICTAGIRYCLENETEGLELKMQAIRTACCWPESDLHQAIWKYLLSPMASLVQHTLQQCLKHELHPPREILENLSKHGSRQVRESAHTLIARRCRF